VRDLVAGSSPRAPRPALPGPASLLHRGSPLSPPPSPTFVAGAGQEGPERGAQEKARPKGGPARCGVAAGQGRGCSGDVAVRCPPASLTPGPRAPHFLPTLFLGYCPAPFSLSYCLAEGRRESQGSSRSWRVLRLMARESSKCRSPRSAEIAEVCSGSFRPLPQEDEMNY
jgi:hypothetical protein